MTGWELTDRLRPLAELLVQFIDEFGIRSRANRSWPAGTDYHAVADQTEDFAKARGLAIGEPELELWHFDPRLAAWDIHISRHLTDAWIARNAPDLADELEANAIAGIVLGPASPEGLGKPGISMIGFVASARSSSSFWVALGNLFVTEHGREVTTP